MAAVAELAEFADVAVNEFTADDAVSAQLELIDADAHEADTSLSGAHEALTALDAQLAVPVTLPRILALIGTDADNEDVCWKKKLLVDRVPLLYQANIELVTFVNESEPLKYEAVVACATKAVSAKLAEMDCEANDADVEYTEALAQLPDVW